jgi:hypothetical protein
MSKVRLFVSIALALFGVWLLLQQIPVLLTGPTGIWSFAGRSVQCVFALLSAFAVFTDRGWASLAIGCTGVAVAVTALGDAFVVGITAPLAALAIAVIALAVALLLAWLVRRDTAAARSPARP